MRTGSDIGWIVVRTVGGEEFEAQGHLLGKGYQVWCPWQLRRVNAAPSRARYEKRAYFSSYVFVYVRLGQCLSRVRKAHGVVNILTSGADIIRVPQMIMDRLMQAAAEDGYISDKVEPVPLERFRVGDAARVLDGPFADVVGEVAALDGDGEITLWISAFGRKSPLRIASSSLVEAPPLATGSASS